MLELTPVNGSQHQYALGVAGDTYNTAVALAQLGCKVEYLSGLGTDSHSDRIANAMDDSGVGISLALCGSEGRRQLLDWLGDWRAQRGVLIYDSTYRAALWSSLEAARQAHREILGHCDIFLPGVDDGLVLHDVADKSALTYLIQNLKTPELVLKDGGNSLVLFKGAQIRQLELEPLQHVVDATGAGDSFSGAYLAARILGKSMPTGALFACRVAAQTIATRGAVLASKHWESLRGELQKAA
jgi:2-dehydro-3-deoxygluconokinase